jgi:hypothetical protein
MKNKIVSILFLLIVSMICMACAPQATDIPATPSPSVQGDPTEGQASLMNDLRSAGMDVEMGNTVEQPFFAVNGRIIKVNDADVQIFEYQSAKALEADAAQVTADGGSVGTSMISWMATPHFFKSGHILVLYVGDNPTVLEALKSILGEQFAGR